MSTITELRRGLSDALSAIPGLRVSSTVPTDPKPPIAIVMPPQVRYDLALGRGLHEYTFTVLVLVGGQDQRTMEERLTAYCDATGTSSVAAAVYADRTLGGVANDSRVTDMRSISPMPIAENSYLAGEFVVTVYA